MKVSNPLTIIAIFAGLAETLATVALVKLPPDIQVVFVYFVMAFPSGIVLLFFFVLFFKNTVLYAPSDYDNQNHYLEANQIKENVSEQVDKIFTEINKSGIKLTKSEIDDAKVKLEKSIDNATSISIKEKILEFLNNNPSTTLEISRALDISKPYTLRILSSMKRKGDISSHKKAGAKKFTWTENV